LLRRGLAGDLIVRFGISLAFEIPFFFFGVFVREVFVCEAPFTLSGFESCFEDFLRAVGVTGAHHHTPAADAQHSQKIAHALICDDGINPFHDEQVARDVRLRWIDVAGYCDKLFLLQLRAHPLRILLGILKLRVEVERGAEGIERTGIFTEVFQEQALEIVRGSPFRL